MGTLIGWCYPTGLALKLADHTYVSCGAGGRAWGCWGGKIGGTPISQGPGSSARADAIAGHNERAGITCYMVNGVCHQAANRILFPSSRIVRKARGYWVSEALYGTYGRPRGAMGLCKAPFNHHEDVSGDLPECVRGVGHPAEPSFQGDDNSAKMQSYLAAVVSLYEEIRIPVLSSDFSREDLNRFQTALFSLLVEFRLGPEFVDSHEGRSLREIRSRVEDSRFGLEERFIYRELTVDEFIAEYNHLIESFQRDAEEILQSKYQILFELKPGETVTLGDPRIARAAYGSVRG